jgi:uncharacterized membrane protein HdeD (DUF308 family)
MDHCIRSGDNAGRLVFAAGWSIDGVWLPGLFLAIDLMFRGLTLIGFACRWELFHEQ